MLEREQVRASGDDAVNVQVDADDPARTRIKIARPQLWPQEQELFGEQPATQQYQWYDDQRPEIKCQREQYRPHARDQRRQR